MKKILLFLIFYLSKTYIATSDEFPWVNQILSKNSTVWILISQNRSPDSILYKINFDNSGKIYWGEETDYTLYNNLRNEKKTNVERMEIQDNRYVCWTIKYEWSKIDHKTNGFLCYKQFGIWEKAYQVPTKLISILHAGNNGKIWIGGYCFVAYYYNGIGTIVFFMDEYELQGTYIVICEKESDCPEEEPEPYSEEEITIHGDGYPSSVCFCDGRKIGFIYDRDGYVNLRTEPNTTSSIIGIILNRVRIFYWDIENSNWYKVEINGVEGYVHKSRIKQNLHNTTE
jgi:uncharacterized protein YgiM (DUF1202 family)